MTIMESIHGFNSEMTWMKALIYTTSFSYIGAIIATLMGFPVQYNVSPFLQAISYAAIFVILLLSLKYYILRLPLASMYGVVAMFSFSGIQTWIHYAGNGSILGPAMKAWDIALAMALLLYENS